MIKSALWYQRQIKALENAARNTANLALPVTEFMNPKVAEESFKANEGVRRQCSEIYSKLNQLRYEFNLYHRG